MFYAMYCDVETLLCDNTKFEEILGEITPKSCKVSKNFWLFEVERDKYSFDFVSLQERVITHNFGDYTTDKSVIFVTPAKDSYYLFPQDIEIQIPNEED